MSLHTASSSPSVTEGSTRRCCAKSIAATFFLHTLKGETIEKFSAASGAPSRHNACHQIQSHVSDERRLIGIKLLFSEFAFFSFPSVCRPRAIRHLHRALFLRQLQEHFLNKNFSFAVFSSPSVLRRLGCTHDLSASACLWFCSWHQRVIRRTRLLTRRYFGFSCFLLARCFRFLQGAYHELTGY